MRRNLVKCVRPKYILLITVIASFLYLLSILNNVGSIKDVSPLPKRQENLQVLPMTRSGDYNLDLLKDDDSLKPFVPTSLKKIDWHDYKQIELDLKKEGVGEQGKPASLPKSEAEAEEKLYNANGFNGLLSDKISLTRAIRDIRHPGCKKKLYLESLPTVSVVVPFHNEHWSTLLRTAAAVLQRSPPQLIREIILVDDGSTKPFLKEPLEQYVSAHLEKVRVVRLDKRRGLISARLEGAARARGQVLLFLDSHTEPNVNWLPPLLEPIAENYRTVVCPFIDVVAHDTFEYRAQDQGARGAFDWELYYKRLPLLPADEARMPEPFESPVMAGGLFAISRAFFWQLGGYDPGLDIWGGEQYELSFKIWQCGGRMLDAPCSRVGHIYRKFAPFPDPDHGDFVAKNYRRVAEVWMDEYAEFLYARRPHYRRADPGDLTEQKALRRRLQCKPFRWFMTQIAFDLPGKYPPVEPGPFAEGRIRPASNPELCVDARRGAAAARLLLAGCAAGRHWRLGYYRDVRSLEHGMCWDVPDARRGEPVRLYGCHLGGGNQLWRYHPDTKEMKFGDSGVCLDWEPASRAVFVSPCRRADTQAWLIDTVYPEAMARWHEANTRVTGPVEPWNED